ncbi:MAG: DnaJ C-terminal domain-containing protein [Acetobacteraceae bacterium]
MNADPYKVLGVAREASQDEIRAAYRKLAKKLHPDLNPGNKGAEERFKDVAGAYDLLGDAEKRARFDRGEIDATGAERQRQTYYRDYADSTGGAEGGARRYESAEGYADFAANDDILAELFGQTRSGGAKIRIRGADIPFHMHVDFLDAVNGATRRLSLPDGSTLDVTIPPGIRDGQLLRLKGKGRPGLGGGPPGDALIEIEVLPHPVFTRQGDDIRLELPISLNEAVLGGRVDVPTPGGAVTMTVPKGSNSDDVLRIRGRGVPRRDGSRGDEYVTLRIVLPRKPDPELESFAASWEAGRHFNPREEEKT